MRKKEDPKHCKTPPASTGEPSNEDALQRLADELGRIVGKFLAEEATKQTDGPARNSPAARK
jgi:hypothetical protein